MRVGVTAGLMSDDRGMVTIMGTLVAIGTAKRGHVVVAAPTEARAAAPVGGGRDAAINATISSCRRWATV